MYVLTDLINSFDRAFGCALRIVIVDKQCSFFKQALFVTVLYSRQSRFPFSAARCLYRALHTCHLLSVRFVLVTARGLECRLMELAECRPLLSAKSTDVVGGAWVCTRQPATFQVCISALIQRLRGHLTTMFRLCLRIGCKIIMFME
jgi:hypothetical protein